MKNKIAATDLHIKVYNVMKDNDAKAVSIFRTTDSEMIRLLLEFIKTVIIGNTAKEQEFVDILKEDLMLLKRQPDNSFLENFFFPMIKSEPEVPVCLYPYDYKNKKWISDL